ncbi:MAG TPA: cyclic nucleotide-binding domain-containing protein [Actinomycetota bacterium]|jgi:CRP-like cAMP-binding protein|nr:cyclic nucleotide-binding domain-containing protein [Actinomycetota bacterium]
MAQDELVDRLRTVAIFRGLDDKELHRIAEVGKQVHFDAGKVVAQQDGGAAGFHLIMDGEVSVDVDGHERARLGSGNYFGEMSLLDGKPRSATVKAEEPTTTFALTSWQFLPLLAEYPSISRALLVELCARLRRVEQDPVS